MTLTDRRLYALRLVADGQVEYATSYGNWEPKVGYRLAAFDWLVEKGLIRAVVEAEPVGRVMKLVPVVLTEAGAAVLREADASANFQTPEDER